MHKCFNSGNVTGRWAMSPGVKIEEIGWSWIVNYPGRETKARHCVAECLPTDKPGQVCRLTLCCMEGPAS